jgi:hypothetical protein
MARRSALGALCVLAALAAVPSDASAAFEPGRFVVKGKGLAGNLGKAVSVYARPQAVSVDGCRTRRARVGRARGGVRLRATVRCAKRTVRVVARVRGPRMAGAARSGRKTRRFSARLARPDGVRLKGRPSARAVRAVRDVARFGTHLPGDISTVGGARVTRQELVVLLGRRATVGQVNSVLVSLGGGVVASLRGSTVLGVGIPDPGTPRALAGVLKRVRRMPGVARADLSLMPDTAELPPGVGSPPSLSDQVDLSHLLASRTVAAFNARGAIQAGNEPAVVIGDHFGGGPLPAGVNAVNSQCTDGVDNDLDGDTDQGRFDDDGCDGGSLVENPNDGTQPQSDHGYHVTGIVHGNFSNDGSAAGLVTGSFPARGRQLVQVDTISRSSVDTNVGLVLALERVGGHVVLNTSLQHPDATLDQLNELAFQWTEAIGDRLIDRRMVHMTAAGNYGILATLGTLWGTAALQPSVTDGTTTLPALTDIGVVENVQESLSGPSLGCLLPGPPGVASNFGGTIAAPGTNVLSFDRLGNGLVASGTSMSSPFMAGLATYMWSIAPDLRPQDVLAAIIQNPQPAAAGCSPRVAPAVDAYQAVLSLDGATGPTAAGYPVRRAILDLNGDGAFTEADLSTWIGKVAETLPATAQDWSRYDLNGDGFTGGTKGTQFDLDRGTSTRAGRTVLDLHAPAEIEGHSRDFDETALQTDEDLLCYYAYSPLYSGDPAQRTALVGHCRMCDEITSTFSSDHSDAGTDFLVRSLTFRHGSGRVLLASNCDGDKPISVDDGIEITITHADGSTASFSHDFSDGCSGAIDSLGPTDLTPRFEPGNNAVEVHFKDLCGQAGSSTSRVLLVRDE